MSLPQKTAFPWDYRPIIKNFARSLVANILGMYVFLTIGMMGQVWVMIKAEEHSLIIKPFVWGLAYACGMFVSGGYSEGSFHPGVTLGYALVHHQPGSFKRTIGILLCDLFSAVMAASTVFFLTYYEMQAHFGKEFRSDGTAREVYVHEYNSDSSTWEVIADGALSSFLYAIILSGILDEFNLKIDRCWQPLYTGINVTVVGLAFGYVHGSTFNPYIDLVPRLTCSCVGFVHCWGKWWLILLSTFFTMLFAMLGTVAYRLLIRDRIKDRDHLVPLVGGRLPPQGRATLSGAKQDDYIKPHLVREGREDFNYLLRDEDEHSAYVRKVPKK